ncbi:unnamed protein product [Plutella xylostella]|uniref:DNA-directed DNA polymerase n=1 Tax=Plutella xylostella TaxID=51655 RepID=A0A8S4FQH0_PLUXY|nr:unnamed protein product [Plutella xylostella]
MIRVSVARIHKIHRRNYCDIFPVSEVRIIRQKNTKNDDNLKVEELPKPKNVSKEFRVNEVNIQLISKNIHEQLFKQPSPKLDPAIIKSCQENLKKHGINISDTKVLPDVELKLPELKGKDVVEHFYNIGEEQSRAYRELLEKLVSCDLPPLPKKWSRQAGWCKYVGDGPPEPVPCPTDDALIFDVEVLMSAGKRPTLACAVSPNAWYGWVSDPVANNSPHEEFDDVRYQDLIPLETDGSDEPVGDINRPRIVVGHNVAYDRAKVKEQYWLEKTGVRFMDTMSMHTCVSGVTSYQRAALKSSKEPAPSDQGWMEISSLNSLTECLHTIHTCVSGVTSYQRAALKSSKEPAPSDQGWMEISSLNSLTEVVGISSRLNHIVPPYSIHTCVSGVTSYQRAALKSSKEPAPSDLGWMEISSLNSLTEVHKLYCGSSMDKQTRDVFVEGKMADVIERFPEVMSYCAADVGATWRVLVELLPLFMERFPHPVTLAGMLELGSTYLPVNSNWTRYIESSETVFQDLNLESRQLLSLKADEACRLMINEEYKNDLWMWNQDWSTQTLKLKKATKKKMKEISDLQAEFENLESDNDIIQETNRSEDLVAKLKTFQVLNQEYIDLKTKPCHKQTSDSQLKVLSKKFQYLFDLAELLPVKRPYLPGYPAWYRKLCTKPGKDPDWIPGANNVTTSMQITPSLLRLSWEGYPLHYLADEGWGFLVPSSHYQDEDDGTPSQPVLDVEESQAKPLLKISGKDVETVIKNMRRGKSPGHDDLSIEHLQHAGVHVNSVLAMFFNICIRHEYLPEQLMKTVVIPIVKNKTGDLADKSNYRPISLATVVSKVLDGLLERQLSGRVKLHDAQFGFRPGLSTESAICALKHTVRYYTDRRTPVYAAFLDLSKAFDLVSYDKLWLKLQELKLPSEVINIFRYWYSNQSNVVKWANTYSDEYILKCGVRQGGLSSPALFNIYIDQLIVELSNTTSGCSIDGLMINNISYADDMVLLSPSISALRKLLCICEKYAESHGLQYNVRKSELLVFRAGRRSPTSVPPVTLCGCTMKRVTEFRYLGHLVNEDLHDDADIERERRALSVRCNMVARRFARSNREVKVSLFKAYCQTFYTCSLWVKYTQKAYSALRVQYNNSFRILLRLPRFCSASAMFADSRTDGFHAILRKRAASMMQRIRCSSNSILNTLCNRYDSPIWQHWVALHNISGIYFRIPLKQLLEKCPVVECKQDGGAGARSMEKLSRRVEEDMGKRTYYARRKLDEQAAANKYHGLGVWTGLLLQGCCHFFRLPHKDGPKYKVGNPLARDFLDMFSQNVLSAQGNDAEKVLLSGRMMSYWRNNRSRILGQQVVWRSRDQGAILPQVVVAGTLTRRASEPTWMTASNAHAERVGSELRAMVQAPPGYRFIGADVDSQELWIAALLGDSSIGLAGGSAFGWSVLAGSKQAGSDLHSLTASAIGVSRDHAKVINYARIYGAGQNFAERLLKQFNPTMTNAEAKHKAAKMFASTKGKRVYTLKKQYIEGFMEEDVEDQTVEMAGYNAMRLAKLSGRRVEEMFERARWVGGTESDMFNKLEEIADSEAPATAFLSGRLSRALEAESGRYDGTKHNWAVQSAAADFLHLMLVCMRDRAPEARFCLSFHDEVRYLVPDEHRYEAALALQLTNLMTRAFCSQRVGMNDLPLSVAFFTSVEVDAALRKESNLSCVTPSNPHGLEKGYGIPDGESLDIFAILEKCGMKSSVSDELK